MSNQSTKTVTLNLARSTHGTHVYQEDETLASRQTFPTIYVKKHVLPLDPPKSITVTLTYEGRQQ